MKRLLPNKSTGSFLACLCFANTLLLSCTKEEEKPKTPDPVTDVYAAGYSGRRIVYWKNGAETTLATSATVALNGDSTANLHGNAYDIAVSGNNVYVAGKLNGRATYWKNGVAVDLSKDEWLQYSEARGIAVSGSDVYIAGREVIMGQPEHMVLWKNGVKSILPYPDGVGSGLVTDVAVSGSDVYVCGNLTQKAVYWKNGESHILPSTTSLAEAWAMAVVGTDVYVGGRDGFEAAYWKNGVRTILDPGRGDGIINGIYISGSDVYMVGQRSNAATIWKNDAKTLLESGAPPSVATAVAVDGSDVYVAGNINTLTTTNSVCWKNGAKTSLTFVSEVPHKMAMVNAITVVKH